MKWKGLMAVLLGLLIVGVVGYTKASPIGGARVTILDTNGKPLTDYGKVYYTVWTFDENGSIKVLRRGSMEKRFIFSNNVVKLSSLNFKTAKEIAKKKGSKTAFIGVDVWIVKDGKLYTLPPEGFETGLIENTFANTFKLRINLKEARIKDLKRLEKRTSTVQPMAHDVYYVWETVDQKSYRNVKIPILIIHNKAESNVFGTADVAMQVKKHWGPDVTVAFGDEISKRVTLDPDSITVKVLGRSITDYFSGGDDITVPSNSWGYVWLKGTVHYIYQKEYYCLLSCEPTGNERYFAKIDSFTIKRKSGDIKVITSGASFGKPPYNFPDEWMEKSGKVRGAIEDRVGIDEFYGKIYSGTDGHSFGVGVPVGAILTVLSGYRLPPWFAAISVGFSTSDYASYVMLGHVKNKGPQSSVTFYAMESRYTVEIPVKHGLWTSYERVHVPVGLYIEVNS
ncbi:hypothetical protein [Thermococcus sp. 21S7]|uniref:hypothetical protein n=1 Tax=Thermococcus sp. 21S7 TaxID=1638221 RepID=UPI00143A19C1|nr:hypothetical protein [Thermococcus sp. 21S7]NJE61712.1 hypothetical protein [Thermococcus sp. 21S7]